MATAVVSALALARLLIWRGQRRRRRSGRLRAVRGSRSTSPSPRWVPGIEEVVELWNDENPDIQVKVQTGPNGNGGTYQNFFNQIKAGNAPDLGQIEYDALPNFRVQDGLENLAACEGVLDAEDEFIDWTWSQVTFGEDDAVYAIPQDTGPMAMYLPRRPVRGGRHPGSHHLGGVRGGGGSHQGAGIVHHELPEDRHQPVRRTRLAGGRAVVRERRRELGCSADVTRVDRGRRLLAGPDRQR